VKVNEFKAFLLELAHQHMVAGELALSKDLHKLSELFDERSEQPVKTLLDKIRKLRGI
jgi:hypothetical protein